MRTCRWSTESESLLLRRRAVPGAAVGIPARHPGTDRPLSMCAMRGQAYVAGTTIYQELAENERVTILCIKSQDLPSHVG
jgi:hypothetical protein